jgi:hypothetical protein
MMPLSFRCFPTGLLFFVVVFGFSTAANGSGLDYPTVAIVPTPTDGGIREDIPSRYRDRYEKWKAELMSTEYGRTQWEAYSANRSFVLTIKLSAGKGKGAGTDKFQWDDKGNFVGATITLGTDIDQGYPSPIYYPVLNSLSADGTSYMISGRLLAATKLSHELGHVNQTAKANVELIEKQSKLIPEYTSIFLRNGHNTKDSKLLELAEEIGGTPVEIWESREYWSEVAAMSFLREKIRDEPYFCHVFSKIRNNVETYARVYMDRFEPEPARACTK